MTMTSEIADRLESLSAPRLSAMIRGLEGTIAALEVRLEAQDREVDRLRSRNNLVEQQLRHARRRRVRV
jgi:hypothetical protein